MHKNEKDHRIISYERRVYESVYDNKLSYVLSYKSSETRTLESKGYMNY